MYIISIPYLYSINKDIMESLLTTSEGILKSQDNEELNYRVYSDGWVKIEGLNMREDFESTNQADIYISNNNITK